MFRKVVEGDFIDKYNNFSNFGTAMLTLFRCATGEDWGMIMFDLSKQEPDCVPDKTCGTGMTFLFYI